MTQSIGCSGCEPKVGRSRSTIFYCFIFAAFASQACGTEPGESTECASQAIMGGSPVWPGLAGVGADDGIAYVWIVDSVSNGTLQRFCTVSRICVGRGITAAHCVGDADSSNAWMGLGPVAVGSPPRCGSTDATLIHVTGHSTNPTHDIDVIDFDDPGGPVLGIAETPPELDATVLLAGYGLSESGTIGEKRYAESTVVAEDLNTMTISSSGRTGACVGDSGGPLLVRDQNGEYSLAGVLSEGSLSCKAQDIYTSIFAVKDWLKDIGAQ